MDIEVSPPALTAAADTWDGLADQAQAMVKRLRSADDGAGSFGKHVDQAARMFIAAWVREAERRVDSARSNADLLRRASRDYVEMDHHAVALLRSLMPWQPLRQNQAPFTLPPAGTAR